MFTRSSWTSPNSWYYHPSLGWLKIRPETAAKLAEFRADIKRKERALPIHLRGRKNEYRYHPDDLVMGVERKLYSARTDREGNLELECLAGIDSWVWFEVRTGTRKPVDAGWWQQGLFQV